VNRDRLKYVVFTANN